MYVNSTTFVCIATDSNECFLNRSRLSLEYIPIVPPQGPWSQAESEMMYAKAVEFGCPESVYV